MSNTAVISAVGIPSAVLGPGVGDELDDTAGIGRVGPVAVRRFTISVNGVPPRRMPASSVV